MVNSPRGKMEHRWDSDLGVWSMNKQVRGLTVTRKQDHHLIR